VLRVTCTEVITAQHAVFLLRRVFETVQPEGEVGDYIGYGRLGRVIFISEDHGVPTFLDFPDDRECHMARLRREVRCWMVVCRCRRFLRFEGLAEFGAKCSLWWGSRRRGAAGLPPSYDIWGRRGIQ
jgi:hypothetical protein